MAALIPSES